MASENDRFDVVVIGSGPGGYSAAIRANQKKLRVALVEKDKVGGTCLNRGCIPTKTLLHDAVLFSKLKGLSFLQGSVNCSFEALMQRKDDVVAKSVNGFKALMMSQGITIMEGEATLLSPRSVQVRRPDGSMANLETNSIVLATGSSPRYQSPFQVDEDRILGTTQALALRELPQRVAVIGGDYKGIEFATIFQSLGCQVVLIEGDKRILPTEDMEVSSRLKQFLAGKIKVLTRSQVEKIKEEKCALALTVQSDKGQEELLVDRVLVIGERVAHVDGLGLDRLGLSLHGDFLPVGNTQETSVRGIYAVGDLVGGDLFAHKALAEGVSAVAAMVGAAPSARHLIPRVIFSDPEVGAVGLTQRQAEEKEGRDGIVVGKFPIEVSGRAMSIGEPRGSVKVIAGKKYGEVLGVHIIGPHATELISLACLAMKNELGVQELRESLFAHPTLSEAFHEAVLNVWGEAIHFAMDAS